MDFEIIGEIEHIETIAVGSHIRDLKYLQKVYGRGRWRKPKGIAFVKLPNGNVRHVELHWYEAHGIGTKDIARLPATTKAVSLRGGRSSRRSNPQPVEGTASGRTPSQRQAKVCANDANVAR